MTVMTVRPLPQGNVHSAIRSILVPLAGQPEDRRCLKAAGALAQRSGAHVSALYVLPDPLDQLTTLSQADIPIPDSVLAHQAKLNDEQRRAVEGDFAAWRAETGLAAAEALDGSASLHIAVGGRAEVITGQALLSDLVICALPGHAHPARFASIAHAVFEAGRPVLALPMQAPVPAFAPQQRAALAWNGTVEAARALTASLPLLGDCAELVVLSVDDGKPRNTLDPVLTYLRRHGIAATGRHLPNDGEPGAALHRAAHEAGARMLVMGVFGHSLARELVFGGVTDFMLKNATIPLLLAH
jgi:nucleotide-binding universal stress UspA family protein